MSDDGLCESRGVKKFPNIDHQSLWPKLNWSNKMVKLGDIVDHNGITAVVIKNRGVGLGNNDYTLTIKTLKGTEIDVRPGQLGGMYETKLSPKELVTVIRYLQRIVQNHY